MPPSFPTSGNLLRDPGADPARERFETLLETPSVRIERIVSLGQSSPAGFWYDQPEGEWVVLLAGEAALEIEGEPQPRRLRPGDWVWLPPHCRHRVVWTAPDRPSIWLAVHLAIP
ncbi:MAG: cupin domain-containing protein [Geminicoccaceae bacterium]|nr:cupin domain-containing protein [Geminicoccaceae bacterium]